MLTSIFWMNYLFALGQYCIFYIFQAGLNLRILISDLRMLGLQVYLLLVFAFSFLFWGLNLGPLQWATFLSLRQLLNCQLLRWVQIWDPATVVPQIAGIMCVYHHARLLWFWRSPFTEKLFYVRDTMCLSCVLSSSVPGIVFFLNKKSYKTFKTFIILGWGALRQGLCSPGWPWTRWSSCHTLLGLVVY